MRRLKLFLVNVKTLLTAMASSQLFWEGFKVQADNCTIDKNTRLGKPYCLVAVTVGFGTAIGPNAKISHTTIGKFCSIGPNVVCGWGVHPLYGVSTNPAFYSTAKQNGFTYSKVTKIEERLPITIGNDVFIGANVTILDGVTIADGAVIGAGAVVSKDIPPYAIAMGCPIKVVKFRFDEAVIEKLLALKWWDKDERTFKKVEEHFWEVSTFLEQTKHAL